MSWTYIDRFDEAVGEWAEEDDRPDGHVSLQTANEAVMLLKHYWAIRQHEHIDLMDRIHEMYGLPWPGGPHPPPLPGGD